MMNEPNLIPIGPMARRLRVPVAWLRTEAESGRVPHLKAGRAFLFVPSIVEKVLADRASVCPERCGKDGDA